MKCLFLPLFALCSMVVFAQNERNDIPVQVRISFQKDYPNVNNARWTENNNKWHASYLDDRNRNKDAYYDQSGNRWDMMNDHNYVPDQVRKSFQREYPNVNDAQWNRTNNQWHASYQDERQRNVDSYYDQRGNRVDTRTTWDRTDVPRRVDYNVNRMYNLDGNYTAIRIQRPSYQPLFKIYFQSGTRNRTVYMDEYGRRASYQDNH